MALPDYTTQSAAVYKANIDAAIAALDASSVDLSSGLIKLIHPDTSKGYAELNVDNSISLQTQADDSITAHGMSPLPDGRIGHIAAGIGIETSTVSSYQNVGEDGTFGDVAYASQGFQIYESDTCNGIWLYLTAFGPPTTDLDLVIYDDAAGLPNAPITNGTATVHTSETLLSYKRGEWVFFEFPTPPSLTSNTQYHFVLGDGVITLTNYWGVRTVGGGLYQDGEAATSETTVGALGTLNLHICFLVETTSKSPLQAGLTNFDGAIHCYEGNNPTLSPIAVSDEVFLNHQKGMINLSGTGWSKDKTFFDSGSALDSNRLVLRCNVTSGFAQVDLYEDDETKHTITGTTDISTGNHIVSVGYVAVNGGADYLKLYVDGVSEGTELTAQSFDISKAAFVDNATTNIGGGFALAPTWTQDLDMTVLPSTVGWTYTGDQTESTVMKIHNGTLHQYLLGFAIADRGYYTKTTTLNNATGWAVAGEIEIPEGVPVVGNNSVHIEIQDGTKRLVLEFTERYVTVQGTSNIIAHDFKKKSRFLLCSKGSDYWLYLDGKLVGNGLGKSTTASAVNQILFGDYSLVDDENSLVRWHSLKYYEGLFNQEASGAKLSEISCWDKDKAAELSSIYNSGTIQPVKTLAKQKNYIPQRKAEGLPHAHFLSGYSGTTTTGGYTYPYLNANHDSANAISDNEFIIVPPGYNWMRVQCSANLESNPTGIRTLRLVKFGIDTNMDPNNSNMDITNTQEAAAIQATLAINSPWLRVIPGDKFKVGYYQNSGGNLSLSGVSWVAGEFKV